MKSFYAFPSIFNVVPGSRAPDGSISEEPIQYINTGMDLRDYFAAAALPTVIASWVDDGTLAFGVHDCRDMAEIAYTLADAMMERRNGPTR